MKESGHLHASAAFTLRKRPRYTLYRTVYCSHRKSNYGRSTLQPSHTDYDDTAMLWHMQDGPLEPPGGGGMSESSWKCFLASVGFMSTYSTRCSTWVRTWSFTVTSNNGHLKYWQRYWWRSKACAILCHLEDGSSMLLRNVDNSNSPETSVFMNEICLEIKCTECVQLWRTSGLRNGRGEHHL